MAVSSSTGNPSEFAIPGQLDEDVEVGHACDDAFEFIANVLFEQSQDIDQLQFTLGRLRPAATGSETPLIADW